MVRYKILVLFSIFYLYQISCEAAGHAFSRLSIENGLSSNQVNAIFKDSHGFIWIGTLEGIDRYDGVEVRSYSKGANIKLENVKTITEDFDKNLWVGTTNGLFRYVLKQDKFEGVDIGTKNADVRALKMLPDSILCVGTTNGLYLVNTISTQTEKQQLSNLSENENTSVTGLYPDNHGNCWIATTNGLIMYSFLDKKSELFLSNIEPTSVNNSFSSICSIGNKLYLGTTGAGIVEFDLSKKVFIKGVNTDNKIILNVVSDKNKLIFAGTNGGGLKVINIRTQEVENIVNNENDPESLSSNSIYSFLLDKDGRYWIGTYSEGLCFTREIPGNFKLHPITSDHPEINKSIRSFYFSPGGTKYFGTRNGFIELFEDGTIKLFKASVGGKNGLKSNIILSVYPFKGDILIGTYGGGTSRFSVSEQKMKPFFGDSSLSKENTYAFDTDESGNLWITSFNGLYRYSPGDGSIVNFNTHNSGLKSDQIFEVTFDSKGRMWVGSFNGTSVYKVKRNKLEPIELPVIPNNRFKTNYVYEDQIGNIWICEERGGLIMVNPELTEYKTYDELNGLPDNSVCAIIERSSGVYWISTLRGLCKYETRSQKFTNYNMSNGLSGVVFTPATVYMDTEGTLFFGNEKGLVYFTPEDVNKKSLSSKIVITDFYLSGRVIKPGEGSVLESNIDETHDIYLNDKMNNIGFRFVALNYVSPYENHYFFKLEGFDADWRSNSSSNKVFYQNLKAGDYVFKVKNANEAVNDPSVYAEINIHIRHTLTKSPFFFVFLLLIVLSGIFILARYIKILRRKVVKMNVLKNREEKHKTLSIPQNKRELIIEEIKRKMDEDKPYLNSHLKLADMANSLSHPIHEISQVLNQDLNQNFSDFVNRYRVEEVKRMMMDKAYEKYTFVAIATQCGFNSKTSFYRIFKKETGKTPAEYLKDIKKPEDGHTE